MLVAGNRDRGVGWRVCAAVHDFHTERFLPVGGHLPGHWGAACDAGGVAELFGAAAWFCSEF